MFTNSNGNREYYTTLKGLNKSFTFKTFSALVDFDSRLKHYHLGSVDLIVVPEITRDAEGGDPVGGSCARFLLHDANPALAPQSCQPIVGEQLRFT